MPAAEKPFTMKEGLEHTVDVGFKCMRLLQNQQETMCLNLRLAKISVQNRPHPRMWISKDRR